MFICLISEVILGFINLKDLVTGDYEFPNRYWNFTLEITIWINCVFIYSFIYVYTVCICFFYTVCIFIWRIFWGVAIKSCDSILRRVTVYTLRNNNRINDWMVNKYNLKISIGPHNNILLKFATRLNWLYIIDNM